MFGAGNNLLNCSKRFINLHKRRRNFCNKTPQNSNDNTFNGVNNNGKGNYQNTLDAYRDLDNLNFTKAAQILFSDTRKQKKFGFDFHLVQLFFALMPSLAVYLVAQYSRYEMRKMDAALEVKKKAEEKEKAKQMEAEAAAEREKELESGSEILKVKERLEALEEVIKEITIETKNRSSDFKSKTADQSQQRADPRNKSEDTRVSDENLASNQTPMQPLKQKDGERKQSRANEK